MAKSSFILKVVREGTEYELIESILIYSKQFDLLIIKFHANRKNYERFERSLKTLYKRFLIIHSHCNRLSSTLSAIRHSGLIAFTLFLKYSLAVMANQALSCS